MTVKTSDDYRVSNFRDYECAQNPLVGRLDLCEGMGGGCNIGHAAVDRHAYGPAADRTGPGLSPVRAQPMNSSSMR
jgi:acetyl-CoA synthetase